MFFDGTAFRPCSHPDPSQEIRQSSIFDLGYIDYAVMRLMNLARQLSFCISSTARALAFLLIVSDLLKLADTASLDRDIVGQEKLDEPNEFFQETAAKCEE